MELFFYSCEKEAPFKTLYEYLDSSRKKLLLSNHKQLIDKIEIDKDNETKDRILDEAIGGTIKDKKILVPGAVKTIFSEWIKEKYGDEAKQKESVFNAEDFYSHGADELNHFIKGMNVEHTEEDKKYDSQFINPNILFVFVFIAFGSWAGYQFYLVQENKVRINMKSAEEALVKGQYNDANKSAEKVNDSYAKTMAVAVKEIEVATKQIEEITEPKPPTIQIEPFSPELLTFLQNANDAFNALRWTTPPDNSVVWWTKKMLEKDPTNIQAKELLKRVIDKYLWSYTNKQQKLRQKLSTPVLPQTQLKDYATEEQRSRITELLGEIY